MSQPHRFLHADSAGAFTPPSTRPMLPIRQNLNRLTALNRTLRAVLIEVAGLAENGKHGAFTGSNELLSQSVGGTVRTITRALAELQRLELLTIEGATKLRRVATTPRLRVCYTGSGAEQLAAVEALNSSLSIDKMSIDTPAKPGLSIDNGGRVYRHSGSVSIDIQGMPYKETKNYNQDNQEEEEEEEQEGPLRSSSASEKKIGELENENQRLAAELADMTQQRDMLRASLLAIRPASSVGATASAPHTGAAAAGRKMPYAESRYATPDGFTALAAQLNYSAAYAPHYLAHIAAAAAHEANRDERGWQNFTRCFLSNDANSARGLITTAPKDATHADESHYPRQNRGAENRGAGYGQPRATGRLDVEAAVAVAGAFASLSAPARPDGAA
ncbi:hypothetical protein D0N36_06820 [Hymenobacter lapidiphilus]|uniref:hypothetical protein n=1 Tax=Hymenobacter sp. CCM 8763 TaxID=2303334 RepID=UPI000E34F08E|nr:hypothetical protein [Hymenobacter sp. CCM 8763]RFP65910.1 hypothetical protein D0N36_06820 [Hymenobacter sp. CCM 8763]